MIDVTTTIALILFSIEWFLIWGHLHVLFRVRLLPRKDLLRIRFYFLFELLTVFTSSFLFTGKLRWLAVIHTIQHGYNFIYWDKTVTSKRIINWGSLDWFKSDFKNRWELGLILGMLLALFYGPYYAWASPGREPAWIQKRIHPESLKHG